MKIDKSLLMKVCLGITAVFVLSLAAYSNFSMTSGERSADETKKKLEEINRRLEKATQERENRERWERSKTP
jgi:hypothetical protein